MEKTNDYSGSKTGNSKSIKAGGLNLLRMLNLFAANTEKASEMAAKQKESYNNATNLYFENK